MAMTDADLRAMGKARAADAVAAMPVEETAEAYPLCDAEIERLLREALAAERQRLEKAEELLREMEEGFRERCNYCHGSLDNCAGLETKFSIPCRAQDARAFLNHASDVTRGG